MTVLATPPTARRRGLLAAAFALTTLAACGGGSSSSPPPPPPRVFTTFQAASLVIGQPSFVTALTGPPSATRINQPYGNPELVGGRLYLPDYGFDRVLGFNAIPTTNGAAADFVLGEPTLATTTLDPGPAADRTDGAQTVDSDGSKLLIVDYGHDRVLVWNTVPTTSGAPADVVIGQASLTVDATTCDTTTIADPESIHVGGGKLVIADSGHNRVLIYNSIPTVNGAAPDVVLGQVNRTHCVADDTNGDGVTDSPTAATLDYPSGVWTDGTRLVVADADNNRILIWTTFPTTDGEPADLVLGQGDMSHVTRNDDDQNGVADATPTARTFYYPYFLDSDGTRLFVADSNNNRVMVWSQFPTTNFAPADVVLGQASFTADAPNDDDQDGAEDATPTARTLSYPAGVKLISGRLFVADNDNSRYLVFDPK